jgi:GTP cyclohydrolase I
MTSATLDPALATPRATDPVVGGSRASAPRKLDGADWDRFEGYAAEILTSFGMDLTAPGTERTPRRFLRALFDATDGYDGDPKDTR